MKTKFFRVCQSGPTIDGRVISPEHIDQMVKNYEPQKYGARISCEHIISLSPNNAMFPAYGDVLDLKAEDGPDGQRVLMARIDATDDLVKLSQNRQKVYWSIEYSEKFADFDSAYLVGLSVTDRPASLGTEIIKFTTAHGGKLPRGMISSAFEARFEAEDPDTEIHPSPQGADLFSRVKEMLGGATKKHEPRFAQLESSVLEIAKSAADVKASLETRAEGAALCALGEKIDSLSARLDETVNQLAASPASPARPQSADGDGKLKTDC